MEDGTEALAGTESKLASVFASEVARERGVETPEQTQNVLENENVIDSTEVEEMPRAEETPQESAATDGRPRDEQTGQFISKEEAAEREQERLYAGRYKTVEELERAVEEKEAFIARQGTDVGSLRNELQSLRSLLEQRQTEQAPATPQQLPANWENMLDEDPAAAVEYAYDADNQAALRDALKAWDEISPGAPRLWVANKQMAEQLSELTQNIGQQSASTAYGEFLRTHPDVEQYAGEMAEEAKKSPHLTGLLESGDPQAQLEVLDFLYTKASSKVQARNADTLATAQQAADAERVATVRQQKEQAAVASATQTPAERRPRNAGHEMLESIRSAYEQPWDIQSGITTD